MYYWKRRPTEDQTDRGRPRGPERTRKWRPRRSAELRENTAATISLPARLLDVKLSSSVMRTRHCHEYCK